MSEAITDKKDEKASGPEWNPQVEVAPSVEAQDEPELARTIGMVGAAFIIFGGFALIVNALGGPERVGSGWATFILLLGVSGLLLHSAFDADLQVRRLYWGAGAGLLGIGAVLCIIRIWSARSLLFGVGYPAMFGGLLFFLTMLRHEEDDDWRELTLKIIGGVGAALAGLAIIVGQDFGGSQFLVPYGLLFGLLGLAYLSTFLNYQEVESDWKRYAGWVIGGIGLAALTIGFLRSAIPPFLHWTGAFRTRPAFYLVPNGLVLMALGVAYLAIYVGQRSEKQIIILIRRELGTFFFSPMAYMLLVGISVIGWVSYAVFLQGLLNGSVLEPVLSNYFLGLLFRFSVICVVPLLTMRLLSEEKRSGTLEQLMTTPIREHTVILAKFFSGLLLFMITWLPVMLYPVAIRVGGGEPFGYTTIFAFLVALTVTGAHFISMGLFFSGLTSNQIGSAVLTFMGMLILFIISYSRDLAPTPMWQAVWDHADFGAVWRAAFQGYLIPRNLIFHLSMTVMWLFASIKVLEARRWS